MVDAEANRPGDAEWVGGDWQRDAVPGGIALCGACRRTGRCRLGLLTESLGEDGTVTTSLVCDESNEGARASRMAAGPPGRSTKSSGTSPSCTAGWP